MRIGIREQLGLLVLLATLIALAVIAIATVSLPITCGELILALLRHLKLVDYKLQLRRQHQVWHQL